MKLMKLQKDKLRIFVLNSVVLSLLSAGFLNAQYNDSGVTSWRSVFRQDPGWYSSDEAIRIADNLLLYQHETGGWPKNINMAKELSDEEKEQILKEKTSKGSNLSEPTIDNSATYTQMRYLAIVYESTGKKRFKKAFEEGLDYLLEAQYDNGGWPQFYPLKEGYYENITFNDGAMIGVMEFLRAVTEEKAPYDFVDAKRVEQAKSAIQKGLEVILKTQIRVEGALTAWCAQYDPVSLEPAIARTYELVSISGAESVGVVEYLMEIDNPSPEIIEAITGAVDWFDRVKLRDLRLFRENDPNLPEGFDLFVGFDPENAKPLWGRFYEIGTNYPMFVGRDGVVKYALSQIEVERRTNYAYLGGWANRLLDEEYPAWCEKWGIEE